MNLRVCMIVLCYFMERHRITLGQNKSFILHSWVTELHEIYIPAIWVPVAPVYGMTSDNLTCHYTYAQE